METQLAENKIPKKLDWGNLTSIPIVHLVGLLGGIYYLGWVHFAWQTLTLAIVLYSFSCLGITAGYHRLFTHQSYKCFKPIEFILLLLGASAVQGSVLKWVSNHVAHHAADKNKQIEDPHDIHKGFWYAHVGWLGWKTYTEDRFIAKLKKKSLAEFQANHYWALMVLTGFVLPGFIALAWGDPLGGILVAGFMRVTVQWHITWSINSIAHTFGDNLFHRTDRSKNNWMLAATFFYAFGEMFHSLHHQFPDDYRNGWKWYHVDPTKWAIALMEKLHLAWDLKRYSKEAIQKAIEEAQIRYALAVTA